MIKKYYKYILLFLFFLFILIVFSNNGNDTIWNYGMAHAIRMGEVPYKDFNIISTPLYPFILSIGLFIKDTYFMFLIEQAFLLTIFIYFIEKIVNRNYILVLISLCFPIFNLLFPNYNFLVLLLLTIIIYLEKQNKSDSIIGITLGLLFLSKHTIGGFIIIASMISTLNVKRGLKRLLFSLIPISIFIIYLLCTKSLYAFFDLSILGLFDFGNHNSSISVFSIIASICILIYVIMSIKKDCKNKYIYYLFGSMIFIIPICDLFHVFYLICFFLIIYFIDKEEIPKNSIKKIGLIFIPLILILNFISNYEYISNISINNNSEKFKAYLLTNNIKPYTQKIKKKYQSYKSVYMISMSSMFFDIECGNKITYFDVPLHGNFGYNGIEKMKNKISKSHDSYFFIQDNNNVQFANELNDYIRSNYKFIEKIEDFEIYYIK